MMNEEMQALDASYEKFGETPPMHFGVSMEKYTGFVKAAVKSGEPIDWKKLLYDDLQEGDVRPCTRSEDSTPLQSNVQDGRVMSATTECSCCRSRL